VVNTYLTFETGAWLFAGEINYGESEGTQIALGDFDTDNEVEAVQALLMANYAYSQAASLTGRVSYIDHENDNGEEFDAMKYTVAHNYAFTDNLALVNELSYADGEDAGADFDSLLFATALIFSF